MCKKLLCMNPVVTVSVGKKTEGNCNTRPNNQLHAEIVIQCFEFLCNESKLLWKMREKNMAKPVGSYCKLTLCFSTKRNGIQRRTKVGT